MCSFPEAFIVVRSFWLSWLDDEISEGTDNGVVACLPGPEQSEADQSNLCIEQIENFYSQLFCRRQCTSTVAHHLCRFKSYNQYATH